MPRFFFDVHDGQKVTHDSSGAEMADADEAADEVASLLPTLANDAVPNRHAQSFAAAVRDEAGDVVYRSVLLYRGWKTSEPQPQACRPIAGDQTLWASTSELRRQTEAMAERVGQSVRDLTAAIETSRALIEASRNARDARP